MALPTAGAFFWCFSLFCQKFCNSFCYVEKMVRSECLGLVKMIYLFNSNYNFGPSTMFYQAFQKYECLLLISINDIYQ